tara:strand:- start:263 stop:1135 length:873 start_codon:yes stop_codon:yes gene_type:complete
MISLVYNYSSNVSTEPLYLQKCISEAGGTSHLWADNTISAFDMFDSIKPDVFICHFTRVTTDMLKYLSNNKNISIVVNVTGAADEHTQAIEHAFDNNNISCPFFFTNTHKIIVTTNTKRELKHILPGIDVFLPKLTPPLFNVDTCYIATGKSDLLSECIKEDNKESYHLISIGDGEDFDIKLNIKDLVSFFDKYKVCNLVGSIDFVMSQLFYEVSFRSKGISLRVSAENQDKINKIFKSLFVEEEGKNIGDVVRKQLKNKHNCFNRTSQLVRALRDEELANKIDKMGNSL